MRCTRPPTGVPATSARFTTDGRIDSLDLTILEDDRGYFPAYDVAPVLRTQTLEDPELEEPADVAFDFMLEMGFRHRAVSHARSQPRLG